MEDDLWVERLVWWETLGRHVFFVLLLKLDLLCFGFVSPDLFRVFNVFCSMEIHCMESTLQKTDEKINLFLYLPGRMDPTDSHQNFQVRLVGCAVFDDKSQLWAEKSVNALLSQWLTFKLLRMTNI